MSFWVAGAVVGSAVIGAVASDRAASKQAKAQRKAIETQNELIGPFTDAGAAGLNALQSFVDEGANFSDTQAFKDITNSSKAGGQFQSGNRATALTEFFATNFRPQRMAELSFLPTLGANTAVGQATNIGQAQQNIGTAQAQGILGIGSNIATGLSAVNFLNTTPQTSLNQPFGTFGNTGNTFTGPAQFNPLTMPGRSG